MKELPFRLRDLPFAARLALTLLLLVNLGGCLASGLHMVRHHENRDERDGLSMTDLQGAYHGVQSRAALLVALESGHPDELGEAPLDGASRTLLVEWLTGNRLSEGYDDIDLGDRAPAEILDQSCVSCHSRNASSVSPAKDTWSNWSRPRAGCPAGLWNSSTMPGHSKKAIVLLGPISKK